MKRVVLAAGGTAGHVFPALAIRRELIERNVEVRLFSDERGLAYLGDVDRSEIDVVPSGGLVSGSARNRARNLGRLAHGARVARHRLKAFGPDLVIGLGGYPSVAPIMMASRLGIPTVLHEQNSVMGAANKLSARSADAIGLTFDPTEGARGKCRVTGNPSRREIVAIGDRPYPTPTDDSRLGVLVIGGSQGSRSVSETVPAALGLLVEGLRRRLDVVHQARSEDHEMVVATYEDAGITAVVESFVDVPETLPSTHLAIARAGATTVCEFAVARRPAVYLPLLTHRDLQQVKNATAVEQAGGAVVRSEDRHDRTSLAATIGSLLERPAELTRMADAARDWSRPDAVSAIIDLLG